jgi:hypothetical protein
VLYVLELKKNFLLISVMEDNDFAVMIKKVKVLIRLEGASPDTTMSIGIREGRLYRLLDKPVHGSKGILDHGSMSVTKDEEHEAPKGEHSSKTSRSGSESSGGKEELAPSSFVKRPNWYELILMVLRSKFLGA